MHMGLLTKALLFNPELIISFETNGYDPLVSNEGEPKSH